MDFGKTGGGLYFGSPSGSLNEQVLRILAKAGHPLETGRRYELTTPFFTFSGISLRSSTRNTTFGS